MSGLIKSERDYLNTILVFSKASHKSGRDILYDIMCNYYGSEKKFLKDIHGKDWAFSDFDMIVSLIDQSQPTKEESENIIDKVVAYKTKLSLKV